jgi:hypothetical protein
VRTYMRGKMVSVRFCKGNRAPRPLAAHDHGNSFSGSEAKHSATAWRNPPIFLLSRTRHSSSALRRSLERGLRVRCFRRCIPCNDQARSSRAMSGRLQPVRGCRCAAHCNVTPDSSTKPVSARLSLRCTLRSSGCWVRSQT